MIGSDAYSTGSRLCSLVFSAIPCIYGNSCFSTGSPAHGSTRFRRILFLQSPLHWPLTFSLKSPCSSCADACNPDRFFDLVQASLRDSAVISQVWPECELFSMRRILELVSRRCGR